MSEQAPVDNGQIMHSIGQLTGAIQAMHQGLTARIEDIKDDIRRLDNASNARMDRIEENMVRQIHEQGDSTNKRIDGLGDRVPTAHFSLFHQFIFERFPAIVDGAADGREVHQAPRGEATDKSLRISSMQPHVANGLIRLHRNQSTLIEQLKFYPEADHDDGPDALEMLWRLAQQFGGEWEYTSAGNSRNKRRSTSRRSTYEEDWDDD